MSNPNPQYECVRWGLLFEFTSTEKLYSDGIRSNFSDFTCFRRHLYDSTYSILHPYSKILRSSVMMMMVMMMTTTKTTNLYPFLDCFWCSRRAHTTSRPCLGFPVCWCLLSSASSQPCPCQALPPQLPLLPLRRHRPQHITHHHFHVLNVLIYRR